MTFRTLPLIAWLMIGSAQAQTRHDILAQCPALADQLPELLATAQRDNRLDADVRVELLLQAAEAPRIESIDGPRRYRSPVRIALQGLDCRSAAPQRQLLTIRFRDPQSRIDVQAPPTPSR